MRISDWSSDVCSSDLLKDVIESINSAKFDRIKRYVTLEAPQYRILLRNADKFLDRLPPVPSRADMEAALHRELFNRETELKKQSTRIIKEAEKIDNYERSEEHKSELQSLMRISYAVFCLKK